MNTLVIKFGGASVASLTAFASISDLIMLRMRAFDQVVVVVSAMGDTTDQLAAMARSVNPLPPKREYDMLLSAGERISIALLAMALASKGCHARSFTGSQSGILTSDDHMHAQIVDVQPRRLLEHFGKGEVMIVAGFSRNESFPRNHHAWPWGIRYHRRGTRYCLRRFACGVC